MKTQVKQSEIEKKCMSPMGHRMLSNRIMCLDVYTIHMPIPVRILGRMVELFISKSDKVLNDQDEYSNSALHQAAVSGSLEVVRILVRTGADKNMR